MHEILARLLPHVEDDMRRKLDEKFGPGPTNQSTNQEPITQPQQDVQSRHFFLLFYVIDSTTCPTGFGLIAGSKTMKSIGKKKDGPLLCLLALGDPDMHA